MNNENIDFDTQNTENNQEKIDKPIEADTRQVIENVAFDEPKFDEKSAKSVFSRIGFGYLIFSGISMIVSLVLQIVAMLVSEEFYQSHLFMNLVTPISMYLFALPLLIAFFRGVKPVPPRKKNIGFGEWVLYLIVGFGFMYIGALIGNYIMSTLSAIVGYDYRNGLETLVDGGSLWVTTIFAVIIAPIGEEIVFRKLLIDRTGKYGCFISALLSGLVFGLMRANLYQFFYAAALGFLLGYLYYTTGRIIYTIAIHAVINLFGSVVSSLLTRGLEDIDMSALHGDALIEFFSEHALQLVFVSAYSAFTYAAMLAAIVLPIVFRKRLRFDKGEIEIPSRARTATVFLNVGMICLIVFYVFEMLLSLIPA